MGTIGSSSTLEVLRTGLRGDAYAPEDWTRLVAMKEEHDPSNVFRFNRNIWPSLAAG